LVLYSLKLFKHLNHLLFKHLDEVLWHLNVCFHATTIFKWRRQMVSSLMPKFIEHCLKYFTEKVIWFCFWWSGFVSHLQFCSVFFLFQQPFHSSDQAPIWIFHLGKVRPNKKWSSTSDAKSDFRNIKAWMGRSLMISRKSNI
jgi:hypothetical protein